MSQHDFEILNADANTGITFRAAVNAALQALASLNSGGTAPTTTYPYMLWPDTTSGLLKQRNGANTAWVTIGTLDAVNWGLAVAVNVLALTGGTLTGPLSWNESGDEYIRIPRLTTAQIAALTPVNGMLVYNTTTSRYQWYNGSWLDIVDTNSTDTLVGKTLTSPTLTTPTLTNPKILTGGFIQDGGGDEFLEFVEAATPVNHFRVENANTGAGPKFSAQGTDADIDIQLEAKGAGKVKFVSGALGAWETKSNDTVYQAATDGFIMGWGTGGAYNGSTVSVEVFTDASNPPTTKRRYNMDIQEGSAGHASDVMCPVRKGDYYKIVIGGSGASAGSIYWIPLG